MTSLDRISRFDCDCTGMRTLTFAAAVPRIHGMRKDARLPQVIGWCAAVLAVAACAESSTAPTEPLGRVIARDSMTAADGKLLPCCGVDASGAHVTIVGGALTFYALAHYPDSVATPAGWVARACVQGVPNGAYVALNGLVTLPDGSAYLLLPCSAGTYSLTLTKQFDYSDGSSRTDHVSLSSGTFSWKRDTLTIEDSQVADGLTASMSVATITVMAAGHTYQFVAVPTR